SPACTIHIFFFFFFFFFQAEDGIRDFHVTGVQTCALPISFSPAGKRIKPRFSACWIKGCTAISNSIPIINPLERISLTREQVSRSEERRVGKECRSRWSPDH